MLVDDIVSAYVALRDQRDILKEKHKAELAPLEAALEQAEAALGTLMAEQGAESIKTKHGTCYKAKWESVKVTDFDALVDYIKATDRFDLLERRVSKTVALELGNVPGTLTETGWRINVRRS